LNKKKIDTLINTLKSSYDDIIIDSPPVHLVPDALILSRLVDLTLYIIRQGFTPIAELDFIKDLADRKELPKINLVFNGVKKVEYGYGYNYDRSYYTTKNRSFYSLAFSDFWSRF